MRRDYHLLLVSQFLSAFGDNAILAVILGQFLFRHKEGLINDAQLGTANAVYTSLLFVPYVFLAPVAGYLGDRFAKTRILISGNAIKLLGTLVAALGILVADVDAGGIFQAIGYLLVGAGACIYSPAKYGILSEILPKDYLVKANGTIEMLTLVAILFGTVTGAKAIDMLSAQACFIIIASIYGLSLLLNIVMTRTTPQANIRFSDNIAEFAGHFRRIFSSPRLKKVVLGTGLFWICGAVMKMNFQPWGIQVLGYQTNTQISILGIWLSFGIMAGSILSGQLHKVSDLSGARRYAWMMAIFVAVLSAVASNSLVIALLILSGCAGGLFLIPLNAALQAETDLDKVGKSIALQNFVENLAMLSGGALVFAAVKMGAGPQMVFLLLAVFIAAAGSFITFISSKGGDTSC